MPKKTPTPPPVTIQHCSFVSHAADPLLKQIAEGLTWNAYAQLELLRHLKQGDRRAPIISIGATLGASSE